jgi:hypothetical protein
MSNELDNFVIVDPDSGTFFGANTAVILDTSSLSDDELDMLDNGTDGDRGDLATKMGAYISDLIDPNTIIYDK